MNKPKIIVFAYSQLGYDCLNYLIQSNCQVVCVFTHQDNPHENIWFDSVEVLAKQHGILVQTPSSLKDEDVFEKIKGLSPDVIFSFYYRHMIPEKILNLASLGAFNMHGSLLPKYRGRCPVNWAILNGETETGATLHYMVKSADAGDIVDQEKVTIAYDDNAGLVTQKINKAAINVLKRNLTKILSRCANRTPQDHTKATYFGGRKPEDGKIDWHQSALDIYNLIRALQPSPQYPSAFGKIGERVYKIYSAQILDKDESLTPGTCVLQEQESYIIACGPKGDERVKVHVSSNAS